MVCFYLSGYVKLTSVVLISLGGFTQQLGYGWAHSLGAVTQILGAFLKLNNTAKDMERNIVIHSYFLKITHQLLWFKKNLLFMPRSWCCPVNQSYFSVLYRLSWQWFKFAFFCWCLGLLDLLFQISHHWQSIVYFQWSTSFLSLRYTKISVIS